MRLTSEHRENFVNKVMASIPFKSKWNREAVIAEIEKRFSEVAPQEVEYFSKKYPDLLSKIPKCVRWMGYRVDGETWNRYPYAYAFCNQKFEDIKTDDLKKHWEKHEEEASERDAMRSRLLDIAKSVTTLAALAATFPELVQFMPTEQAVPKKQLPVAASGIVTELKGMGLKVKK